MKKYILQYIAVTLLSGSFSLSIVNASDLDKDHCPYVEHTFQYGLVSSNQVTPLSLSIMDGEFLRQTGGGNEIEKIQRSVGSIELLLLVRGALQGTNINAMHDTAKKQYAQQQMEIELGKIGKSDLKEQYHSHGTIPINDLEKILENVKKDIQGHKLENKKCNIQ